MVGHFHFWPKHIKSNLKERVPQADPLESRLGHILKSWDKGTGPQ